MSSSSASPEEIRALIVQLADFNTRARAKRRLVLEGKAAVGPLVEALKSPLEGVAWSAAKTLGEMGASDAVSALTEAMSNPSLREVAGDAVHRITGSAAETGVPAGTGEKALRLTDDALAQSVAPSGAKIVRTATGYLIETPLPGGRHQKVDMLLTLKDSDGSPLVAFYTECGAATADRYEWALKMNLKIPFGAFALRDTAEGLKFVMVDAYLRESATAPQLRRAVETLARRADALEENISGADKL